MENREPCCVGCFSSLSSNEMGLTALILDASVAVIEPELFVFQPAISNLLGGYPSWLGKWEGYCLYTSAL